MPATPDFGDIVPWGWDVNTILTLLGQNPNTVEFSVNPITGELFIHTGYRKRDDGCLVKVEK
jgi:hypothetical protein